MNAPGDVVKRVQTLRKEIARYRTAYHADRAMAISPEALDSLKRELVRLEAAYPELSTPDSPTQVVAGTVLPELKKVRHTVPQWSLNDAFDEAELRAFDERVRRTLQKTLGREVTPHYDTELKIDGLHVVLTYRAGTLVTAATRGDGIIGEDVTHNIRTIRTVPETLARPVDLVAEGEVYMTRSGLVQLNATRASLGESPFANPRNAAAGSIRQLDSRIAAMRPLGLFMYDLDYTSEGLPDTQAEELAYLREIGLPVNTHAVVAASIDEVLAFWRTWERKRSSEDYQLDGVVLKVNERTYQEALGHTGKGPRFAIALKFPAEQVTTVIEDITLQVGRTGKLTPVAHMQPVSVAGTTVARATLHNEDFIAEKDIRIGDTVVLQKAGDIIPEIVQVLPAFRTGAEKRWRFPKTSPLCGGDGRIERVPGEAAHRCIVPGSFEMQERKLAHFVGKSALDIDGFGRKTVALLMKHELLSEYDDVFTLTKDELLALPGFKEASAKNLIGAIADVRTVPLNRLLVGLSIDHVGEEIAYLLASEFGTLPALMRASEEKLSAVKGIGPVVAAAVRGWFRREENARLIARLAEHLSLQRVHTAEGTLSGATVVVTGTLPGMSREEAEMLVRRAGGTPSGSVSKKTAFVVAGENAGAKLAKARQLGVPVLTEAEFKKRLGL